MVHAAVLRARKAQSAWAAKPLAERAACIERFRKLLLQRRDDVISVIQRETGKPRVEALTEVLGGLNFARFNCREAPKLLKTQAYRAATFAMIRKTVRVTYEPYGVIALITPWNYPFLLSSGVLLPALISGNAVLLKPSEYTPGTGVMLGELMAEAGLPEGVLTVLPGDGTTGAALINESLDKVFFIGSGATGRKIAIDCAERMIPCVLELGGSDPAIVLADADLDYAALGIAWGRCINAGQTCVAPKRVFVEGAVYDKFVEKLVARINQLRVGSGDVEVGPLIRESQAAALRQQFNDAVFRGARSLTQPPANLSGNANVFLPIVLLDVAADSKVLCEETFGPLLPVVRVRDADEAVQRANESSYGLSASVWATDITRALAVAARLQAGSVMINDSVFVAGMADVPYGGVKASGMGRSHGTAGLLECVQTKTYVIDPWAHWRQAYWYGYSPKMTAGMDDYAVFEHGSGILRRLISGLRAVKALYFGRD